MKKKIVVLVVFIILLALTSQVAFADPTNPPPNDNGPYGGSCNMLASWWDATGEWFEEGEDPGPGNPNPKVLNERGMYNVHLGTNPHHGQQGWEGIPDAEWYPKGATNMDLVTAAHCGG